MKSTLIFIIASLLGVHSSFAAEKTTLRIGVQTSGTLEWELAVFPESLEFEIQAQPLATTEATKIALQSGAVDMIVSDWLWVSQTRNTGSEFTFYPYSNSAGALMVPATSAISEIKDLAGKRLGIAGGELDKNWLLLQAVGEKQNVNLNTAVEKTFGAPPLIDQQLKNQRVDAVLTYWHFAAQLEAQGYRQLFDGKAMQQGLGVVENVPTLGYVFKESWANEHKTALKAFFDATKIAKDRLCNDSTLWQKATLKMESASPILRERYCKGRVDGWTSANQQAAQKLYRVLVSLNSKVGSSENLAVGTFWTVE